MPGMPHFPIDVPDEHEQKDGTRDHEAVYQTHRGKKPSSRNVGGLPPTGNPATGLGRYSETEGE